MIDVEGVITSHRVEQRPKTMKKRYTPTTNYLKGLFLRPYTTSNRDFKSPALLAIFGPAIHRDRPKSGMRAPISLRREHSGPLPRGLTRRDRCSRLPHALELLEPPSLRGWGEPKRASKLLWEVFVQAGGAGAGTFGAGGGDGARATGTCGRA